MVMAAMLGCAFDTVILRVFACVHYTCLHARPYSCAQRCVITRTYMCVHVHCIYMSESCRTLALAEAPLVLHTHVRIVLHMCACVQCQHHAMSSFTNLGSGLESDFDNETVFILD